MTVGDDAEAAVTAPDVDIVVELLGGLNPAGACSRPRSAAGSRP